MADILAAFDELEKKENSKKPLKSTNKKFVNPLKSSGSQRTGRTQTRPQSSGTSLVPPTSSGGDRSPSVISNRRISFAGEPAILNHGAPRRLRVPTKTASLASGFVWEPKLTKYGVSEREWEKFTEDILRAAALPKRAKIMWGLVKQDVMDKLKRDLDFNGDVKTELKQWSAHFRQKGFTVQLELPGTKIKERDDETFEERQAAEAYSKFFRIVITPNAERSASIYSRNSSLTRSITGEGLQARSTPDGTDDDEDEIDEAGKNARGRQ
ncbi:hypothetical protein VTL71DRAFT_11846 [Oculimacula yallundae]|uniref:Uncharacterized protein n=1 Tax=Oculimacula yallundae TaxID=86028 RepID=A0ABR4CT22_9HELO